MSKWELRFFSLIAYGLIGMSIVSNLMFYHEFDSGISSLLYVMIGLLFDLAKFAFIGLFVYFVRDFERHIPETTICVGTWLILSVISLFARYGFLSQINDQYEAPRLKESAIYAQHQLAVDSAQAKLDNWAKYANLDTADLMTQISSYRESNQALFNTPANNIIGQSTGRTVGQMTEQCTKQNWYTQSYCGQWNHNNAQIQQLQAQLNGPQHYQSALADYQTALQSFNDLAISGAANQLHPLFLNLGLLTNSNPSSVKDVFMWFTSLVIELLASLLMLMRYLVEPDQSHFEINITPVDSPSYHPTILPDNTKPRLQQMKNDIATDHFF